MQSIKSDQMNYQYDNDNNEELEREDEPMGRNVTKGGTVVATINGHTYEPQGRV